MIVEKQSGKILAELGEADESTRELSPKKTQQIKQKTGISPQRRLLNRKRKSSF